MAKLDSLLKEIGYRLKEARARKGWTQEQVAEKAGLPTETVSRLERGVESNPTLKLLLSVCEGVGIGVGELFVSDKRYDQAQNDRVAQQIAENLSYVARRDLPTVKTAISGILTLAGRKK